MCTESHCVTIHAWDDGLHCTIIKKVFNRICIAGLYRYSHTDILSIRNFILCIILCIPEFKLIGFKDRRIFFIGKLIVLTTGNTELYIPRKINSGYCDTVTGMILRRNFLFFCFCQIGSCILRALILRIIFSVKNIILVFFSIRSLCDFRDRGNFSIVIFFLILIVSVFRCCIRICTIFCRRSYRYSRSFHSFCFFPILSFIILRWCSCYLWNFRYLRLLAFLSTGICCI